MKNLLSSWFGGAEEPEKPALFEQRPDSGIGNGKAGPSNQLAIENDKDLEMFFDIYVFCHLRYGVSPFPSLSFFPLIPHLLVTSVRWFLPKRGC